MTTTDANISEEIKKLKKRISDLEEEKEDLEDDFNDKLKKEKRKLDEQKNQVEDELRRAKHDLEQTKDQVERLKDDLENAKNSAILKKESLAFVKEILTAQETSSGDMNNSYRIIEDIKNIIVGELVPWSINNMERPQNGEYTEEEIYHYNNAILWAEISRKKWLANKTSIAFVGEFSAGKTSIVNSILSTHLPVSTKATTAIPTYISGGSIEKFQFVSPDNVLKVMRKDTFEKINKEVLDEIEGVSALLKYFVMEYNNTNLQNLSILDTPGFNSNDQEDAQRTIEVINECDALFWVFDVNAGTINKSSIRLIKENLKKPLYVVVNKVDTKSDYDVQQVENLIKRTLSNEGISVQQFLRFSSSDKYVQKYYKEMMSTIMSVPHSNNTDIYLDSVMEWVDELVHINEDTYKTAKEEYNESERQIDTISTNTRSLVTGIARMCEYIRDLGHYDSHFLGDKIYEFSLSEYHSLIQNLQNIYSGVSELKRNFEDYIPAVSDYINNCEYKSNEKNDLGRITEIRESLNKKIAEFKGGAIHDSDINYNVDDDLEDEESSYSDSEDDYDLDGYDDFSIESAEIINTDEKNDILDKGYCIPFDNNRYIGAVLNVLCNNAGTYDIGVKFYTPNGLSANNGEEYSYTTQLHLDLGSNTIKIIGYGSNNPGTWPVGDYCIEYYYEGELMFSAPFCIN